MPWPDHLLSLEEFTALPEDTSRRYEVLEGVLIVSPRPVGLHSRVAKQLALHLDEQLSPEWEAAIEMDLVLRPGFPLGVRVPDVVVTRSELIDQSAPRLYPEDVLIAVEVISPGSRMTDTVLKPVEYAEAGIPHYWVVDLEPPVSLTAYHLIEEFGAYQEAPAVTGEFLTSEPFSLRIDLDAVTSRRR
ncbi:Uma2 family endonuclease [Kutzneria viridogrisea]